MASAVVNGVLRYCCKRIHYQLYRGHTHRPPAHGLDGGTAVPTKKVTIHIDEEKQQWLWGVSLLTGRKLRALFEEMIDDYRDKLIGEAVGCLDPDTGRAFVKVAGEDFPPRSKPVSLPAGRPPEQP